MGDALHPDLLHSDLLHPGLRVNRIISGMIGGMIDE